MFGLQIKDEHVWKNTRPNRKEKDRVRGRERERVREKERKRGKKRQVVLEKV